MIGLCGTPAWQGVRVSYCNSRSIAGRRLGLSVVRVLQSTTERTQGIS